MEGDVDVDNLERFQCRFSHQPRNARLLAAFHFRIQGYENRTDCNLSTRASTPGQTIRLPQNMENLHAPTVPSGPTSGPASTNGTNTGMTFQQLQAKKDNIEAELRALGSVLDSVGTFWGKDVRVLIASSMVSI